MRKIFILTCFVCLVQFSFGQDLKMYTKWEQAKEIAQTENKDILIILTGSEWCRPCKKMDRKVMKNTDFISYVNENLVLYMVDMPGGGIIYNSEVHLNYEKLKKKYNARFLPSMIVVDSNGVKKKLLKGKLYNIKNVMKQLNQVKLLK